MRNRHQKLNTFVEYDTVQESTQILVCYKTVWQAIKDTNVINFNSLRSINKHILLISR